jgi:hypothetical protein
LALVVEVADRIGLTDALSEALGRVRSWRDHDPGTVVRDLAVMLIDGGKCIDHLPSRHPQLFGVSAGGRPRGARSRPSPLTSSRSSG